MMIWNVAGSSRMEWPASHSCRSLERFLSFHKILWTCISCTVTTCNVDETAMRGRVVWNVADSTGKDDPPACWDMAVPKDIWELVVHPAGGLGIGRTRQCKGPTRHPRTGQSTLRGGFPPIEDWNAARFCSEATVIRVRVVVEIDEPFSPSPFSRSSFLFYFILLFFFFNSCFRYSIIPSVRSFEGMSTNGTRWAKVETVAVIRGNFFFYSSSHSTLRGFVDDETASINNRISILCCIFPCTSYSISWKCFFFLSYIGDVSDMAIFL